MNATLSWGECQTHGHTLLGFMGRCTRCYATRETKPAPTHARRHYAGRLGRPRATDLTPRERTIAELVAKGLTQAEVARELGIVRAGISSALERAKARIGVKHVWELVRYVRGGGRP